MNALELALVYLLAAPSRVADTSWIKPGKAAWEWWNASNLAGVDFKSGINTATYKHYIDFAAENGFRGWLIDPKMAGGGPLFDIASHRIDLLNYFFGQPARVTGAGALKLSGLCSEGPVKSTVASRFSLSTEIFTRIAQP